MVPKKCGQKQVKIQKFKILTAFKLFKIKFIKYLLYMLALKLAAYKVNQKCMFKN